MTTDFHLQAESRQQYGKGASRRLRRLSDKVPGIIYGANAAPLPISIPHKDILKSLKNDAFYSHILKIDVAGKTEQVVLKAIQRHPFKPIIIHLDFMRISATEKLTMHVPLHFLHAENAPGVKAGGILFHSEKELAVSCLPKDLPEHIDVDLSSLEIGDHIHLADLPAIPGVEFLALSHGDNLNIVSVQAPRAEEEPEAESLEETEAEAEKENADEDKQSDDKTEPSA